MDGNVLLFAWNTNIKLFHSVWSVFLTYATTRQLAQYHYSLGIFSLSLALSLSSFHLSLSAIVLQLLMNHFRENPLY